MLSVTEMLGTEKRAKHKQKGSAQTKCQFKMNAKVEKDSLNFRLHLGQLEKDGPKFFFSTEI